MRGAPRDFVAAAAYAVARLRSLEPGAVATLANSVLSFEGAARGRPEYEAFRAALADPPRGYGVGRADILPPTVDAYRFAVTREQGGGLVLSGHVPSEALRAEIRAAAAATADGAPVADRMQTARGLPPATDPSQLARFILKVSGLMREGSVAFDDGDVSVAGDALDGQAVPEIEALMRDDRPSGTGAGPVAVVARPPSPYGVAVRREADGVILVGHLPDEETRARLLAALRARFFHERISDRTRLADGAPAGLGAALDAAIGPLSTLARGEVVVTDEALRLSGESLYRESADRLGAALARAMPAGWSVGAAITAGGADEQADGPRDPGSCRERLAARAADQPLRFDPNSSALKPAFYPVLDALAALARICPTARIEIRGHADPAGVPASAEPRPAPETTASLVPVKPARVRPGRTGRPAARAPAGKGSKAAARTRPGKARVGKATVKAAVGKAAAVEAETPEAGRSAAATADAAGSDPVTPEPDLAHRRALAIIEYLLQAGVGEDQVAAPSDAEPRSDAEGIGFVLRA